MNPPNTANWVTSKWARQLELPTFEPTNELELERWFEDAAPKIAADGPTAATVIAVMSVDSPTKLRLVLQEVRRQCHAFKYVEDLADSLCEALFTGDGLFNLFEASLFSPTREETVLEAFLQSSRKGENYTYLCERRGRHQAIGVNQEATIFIRRLPIEIAKLLLLEPKAESMAIRELYRRALQIENALESTRVSVDDYRDIFPVIRTPGTCTRCLVPGVHWSKNCPHIDARCAKCGKIGHVSNACRSASIKDKAGRERIVIEPKASGIVTTTKMDNTQPEQLKTVAGVVDRLLTTTQKEREKARTTYATKIRASENREVKGQKVRKILTIEDDAFDQEQVDKDEYSDSEQVDVVEEAEEMDTDPLISLIEEADLRVYEISSSSRNIMCCNAMINSTPASVVLDSGAAVSVMSTKNANLLHIQADVSIPVSHVKGAERTRIPGTTSMPTPVTIDQKLFTDVRFHIIDPDVPILLSKTDMARLQLKLDLANNQVETPSHTVACYHVGESGTQPKPSIVVQEVQDSPEEMIERAVTKLEPDIVADQNILDLFKRVLYESRDLWHQPQAGRCTTLEMAIYVNGPPKRQNARPCPPQLLGEMNRQLDDLLEAGLIAPSPDCKWVAPCHLIPKPRTDKWRLVIDYRYINTLMEDDSYQMPRINEMLMTLRDRRYFTLIDLNWGFWNVRIEESSQCYTGFTVPHRGTFIWKVVPFGLKVSPSNFQKAVEMALRELLDQGYVQVYIDDIIISTKDLSTHLKVMKQVLDALREGGFFVNFSKAKLLQKELLILGHYVAYNTLKPDPAKIQALVHSERPKDKKVLLSFCAAANFQRMYIPNFSDLMAPLTALTGKNVRFVWGEEQEQAFNEAKDALMNAIYLAMPDFNKVFIIFTDASDLAVSAVLTQLAENDLNFQVVACASKKFTPTQQRWSTSEKEMFAVVFACEHFETYIKGSRPVVYTDHKPLTSLVETQQPKLRRWALRLLEFRPIIKHISGDTNAFADWLSRSLPYEDDWIPGQVFVPDLFHTIHELEADFSLPTTQEMYQEAIKDQGELPVNSLIFKDETAYGAKSKRIYIPRAFRHQVLLWFHASRFGGHQGVTRTANRLKRFVWWPHQQLDVHDFILSCPICSALKLMRSSGGQTGALEAGTLFSVVSMDFIGPRRYCDRVFHLLVIVDHFSRYMVTVLLDQATGATAIRAMQDHWISKFGAPRILLTDHGSQFTGLQFVAYVGKYLLCKLRYSSVQYPQGNGINESSHRILETAIQTTPGQRIRPLEDVVSEATLLYNVTPNRILGDTPSSIVFGQDLLIPGLADFDSGSSEEERISKMRNHRGMKLLARQLSEIEEFASQFSQPDATEYVMGDLVYYKLSNSEKEKVVHYTGEIKYSPSNSFPQRVVRVDQKNLSVRPLWTSGPLRSVPKVQCRRIASYIPHQLRKEVQYLYPKLNYLPAKELDQLEISTVREDVLPLRKEATLASRPPSKRETKRQRVAKKSSKNAESEVTDLE